MAENGATVLVMKIIVIVVAVLMISTVALPAINDATKSLAVEEMQTGQLYSAVSTTDTVTIGYDSDNGPTLNGVALSAIYTGMTADTRYYVISDSAVAVAQYTYSSGTWAPWGVKSTSQLTTYGINDASRSVVWSGGTGTIHTGGVDSTFTYTHLVVPDVDGDYGIWNYADRPWFVDSDSQIYVSLQTNALSYVAIGTLSDLDLKLYISSGSLVTGSTITAVSEPTDYDVSNKLTSISITPSGGTASEIPSYAVVVCPLSYSVIEDISMASLFNVIPILLILVPVMMAVRMMALKRN